MRFLEEIALYIEAGGYGVYTNDATRDIFTFKMPDDPDNLIAIYATASEPGVRVLCPQVVAELPRFQVLVRGAKMEDDGVAYDRAYAIYRRLDTVVNAVLSGTRYMYIQAIQPPFQLGRDENERLLVAANYVAEREPAGWIVAASGSAAGSAIL